MIPFSNENLYRKKNFFRFIENEDIIKVDIYLTYHIYIAIIIHAYTNLFYYWKTKLSVHNEWMKCRNIGFCIV